jgi:hypothetical protein
VTSLTPVFLNSWNYMEVNGYPHTQANLSPGKESTAPTEQGGYLGTSAGVAIVANRRISTSARN